MDGQYSDHIYEVDLAAERSLLRDMFGVDFSYEEWATLLEVLDQVVKGDFSPLDLQVAKPGRTSSQYVSIGVMGVENQESLLNLIEFTHADNSFFIESIRSSDGDSVYIEEDIDKELIKVVGGEILHTSKTGKTVFKMSTDEVLELNRRRNKDEQIESLAADTSLYDAPEINHSEVEERVAERADTIVERLDHIPDSYVMPDEEDMTIGSANHFRLGIVFVDIAGFSEYAHRNNDKDVLFMLNLLIPELMDTVRSNKGAFEKNTGDGILAYFGAGENDAVTANQLLTYIATIKTILANFINPKLEEEGVERVSIKIGAAMGDVFVSRIGVNRLNRRTVVGEPANIASKLEDTAAGHEYLVSQEIKKIVEKEDLFWAEHFQSGGMLSEFHREDEKVKYYDFRGVLEPTNRGNFVS